MLAESDIPHGQDGFYLASAGPVEWSEIYAQVAQALFCRKLIDTAEVGEADDSWLTQAGKALGCPEELVPLQMGGW